MADECEHAQRFKTLLRESRTDGFMSLPQEDRIWLMKHREHAEGCAECSKIMSDHQSQH